MPRKLFALAPLLAALTLSAQGAPAPSNATPPARGNTTAPARNAPARTRLPATPGYTLRGNLGAGADMSGGTYRLFGIAGQAEAGPVQSGGGYSVWGGFLGPCDGASPPIGNLLRASKSGGTVRLDWTAYGAPGPTLHFHAFSSAAPGAAFPGAWLLLSGAITTLTYDDPSAPISSYYLIRAASDCDGLSSD